MPYVYDTNSPYYGMLVPGDPTSSGGSGSGGTASNSQQSSDSYNQSSSYYADPNTASTAGRALAGTAVDSASGYNDFVNNPTAAPAYQNALAGLLQALHPGEREGQRNLADAYRAAGNTASSSYGESLNKYQQGVDRNRQVMASDLLAKLYPQIAAAKFAPIAQIPQLLDAYKLNQSTARATSQGTSGSGPAMAGPGISLGGSSNNRQVAPSGISFNTTPAFQYLTGGAR